MTTLQMCSAIYEVYMRRSAVTALAAHEAAQLKRGDSAARWDSNYEPLRRLVEERVLARLEAIFDAVKALEVRDWGPPRDQARAIRLPEVLQILGISKSCLYDRLNPKSSSYDPDMPRPFKLGSAERSPSVWWHSAVIAYLMSCAQLHHRNGG